MKNRNVLILDVDPYGALTDSVKWSQYLSESRKVKVVCFTQKDGTKAQSNKVNLIQVPNLKNRNLKALLFYIVCFWQIIFFKGVIMIVFFPHCELFKKLIPWKKYLLDIRTLSVSENESTRNSYNTQIQKACRIYGNVTAISKGVADQIGMSGIKILPLGADVISACPKIYTDSIRLVYVGTFTNRHIEDTIEGVVLFHSKYPEVPISYNIIGYGVNGEEQLFNGIIEKANASSYIHLIGKVPHTSLSQYMDKANIGFSYVPITPYYDYQPPTKTYEYCMSGIFCLGTATAINKELINDSNGLLIDDSAESVKKALLHYWSIKDKIYYDSIKRSLATYSWDNIVNNTLSNLIDSIK